ncbi:hypothetical protein ACIPQH_34790 [Streptomyces rubiginosohelvolus]|uniref:hypothetical protein n=1 Tax=Streptomyces TaxID=1883 RepID=UPI001CD3CCC2|nr:hypothetical protein [Streptomyces sp. 7G]MCA1270810.1 hypothetical protein [Streptomyces sp. 7G]
MKVTFDVYWFGRPRRWFGSLAAVTVPDSLADDTSAAMWENALLALAGLFAGESDFPEAVESEVLLLHATAPARRSAAVGTGRAFLMPVMVGARWSAVLG